MLTNRLDAFFLDRTNMPDTAYKMNTQTEPDALVCDYLDGYRVQWKNDGVDYPGIWAAFRKGQLSGKALARGRPFREADRVEVDGRQYLIKRDWHVEKRLEKRLSSFLMGATRYSRIIQLINQAVRRGCDVVQDVYLVAEKMDGRVCREAWLIADFMPGYSLPLEEMEACKEELCETIKKIHHFGLACNDIQPYNFVRCETDGLIKGIDMDMSSPLVVCQANDVWAMKWRFNMDLSLPGGLGTRLVWALIGLRDIIREYSRKIRGKPGRRFGRI